MRRAEALFGPRVTLAVYAVLTVVVLVPVFAVQVPCLGDYLNHLARIHILTSIGRSPALQRFYEDHWRLVPYFGMDLPVAALARVMPLYAAGQIFVGLCVLMPVLAAATLHYAVHRRLSLVPALGFLVSYNYLLERGFLPYVVSAGLAVMLFAGWVATADWPRWRRAALFGTGGLLLYLSHAFAFAAYGILVGGYELGRIARRSGRPIGVVASDFAAAAAQALPVFALVAFGPADTGIRGSVEWQFGSISQWLVALLSPLYFQGEAWVAATCVVVPGLALALLPGTVLAPSVWPALLALVVVACCVPHWLLGVFFADFRLPLVAAIVLIGAVSRGPRFARPLAIGVLAVTAVLVLTRSVDALVTLRRLDAQVAQLRQVVAALPVGARLLVVDESEAVSLRTAEGVMKWHMALVATIDRDAFVPFLFTDAKPVQARPEFRQTMSPYAKALSVQQLWEGFARHDPPEGPPAAGNGGTIYWLGWTEKFDDVLVLHFGTDLGRLPPVLQKLAGSDVADLYRVTAQ